MMNNIINQDEINSILWKACDTFRGTIDPSEYKNYILVMLFLKYISDVWQDRYAELMEKYNGDQMRVDRQLRYERFILPEGSDYYTLYDQQNEANLGELINIALEGLMLIGAFVAVVLGVAAGSAWTGGRCACRLRDWPPGSSPSRCSPRGAPPAPATAP